MAAARREVHPAPTSPGRREQVRQQAVGGVLDAEAAPRRRAARRPARPARRPGRGCRRWRGPGDSKKGIEDGSASLGLDPDRRSPRRRGDPVEQPRLEASGRRRARRRPGRRADRGRRSARRGRRSARWPARRAGCAPGRAERAAERRAGGRPRCRAPRRCRRWSRGRRSAVSERLAGEAAEVGRLADHADRDQPRAGRLRGRPRSPRRGRRAGRRARGPRSAARRGARRPAPGRRARRTRSTGSSSRRELVGALARVVEVAASGSASRLRRVLETTSSPNSTPIRIPIASARKTAASEAAW